MYSISKNFWNGKKQPPMVFTLLAVIFVFTSKSIYSV